ncbi:Alpha/Beta hydrolase fold [Naviculisporaceae sp. PSN 640]
MDSPSYAAHMGLSTSISSLSSSVSSARSNPQSSISKTYRQASTLFLTRRLPEALSTVSPLITQPPSDHPEGAFEPAPVARASRTTRIKVWSLYLTILNAILELDSDEGKESFGTQEWRALCVKVRDGEVWEEVIRNGYHGVEGDVDADVVINLATLLLTHAKNQNVNQKRLENYLAAARTPNLDISERFKNPTKRLQSPAKGASNGADTPRDLNARVKILELYTLHVLPRNNEWGYAAEFITNSAVLDEERREAFLQALQSLQEEQEEAERREQEERQRREDAIRRDIEEARRLRAENEERERKRLEEERRDRKRREEGSEVDYGIDKTPSVASSVRGSSSQKSGRGKGSATPARKPATKQPTPGSAKLPSKASSSQPVSLANRASMVISNVQNLVQELSLRFQTNPFVLYRTLAFIITLLLMLSRRNIRERISKILGQSWDKVKATAGMGVKHRLYMEEATYICPRTTQINNLGTTITVFFQTLAEGALVADAHQGGGAHVGVADRTFAVALVAEAADCDAGLRSAPSLNHGNRRRHGDPEEESVAFTSSRRRNSETSIAADEQRRARRLFGGILGTLSRSQPSPQQKKRLEADSAQLERVKNQRKEGDKIRAEKVAKRQAIRAKEQEKLEEDMMDARHKRMFALAHSLKTRSEPRLYYQPWKLTDEQEDIIDDQISETRDTVDRELRDFRLKKGISDDNHSHGRKESPSPKATAGERKNSLQDTNPKPTPAISSSQPLKYKDPDDNNEEMVQDKEDTRPTSTKMFPDHITPNDPRVGHHIYTTSLSKVTYHYLLANPPSNEPNGTVLLIHGWPDFSYGWRYQIPYLLSLNLRVVVPDMIGYGHTSAPQNLELYSLKHVSDDMAELMAKEVLADSPNKRFIIGGHDWGGFFVWRFILYYPYLVQGVFSVCTPYSAPREQYLDLETITRYKPNFKYQLHLASGAVDNYVTTRDRLRAFFNGIFGGRTPEGKSIFTTENGVDLEQLLRVGPSPIIPPGDIEYYVDEYMANPDARGKPLRGGLNWYRTTRIKWEEELPLAQAKVGSEEKKISTPALMVLAKNDATLPPSMARGMDQYFENLTVRGVETSHWALVEDPVGVNGFIGEFIRGVLEKEGRPTKASL